MDRMVEYRVEEGVATLRLNRPQALNALSSTLKDELRDAIAAAAGDAEVRCVLLTGAGRAFCAGGDVKEMAAARTPLAVRAGMRRTLNTIVIPLARMPKPVIAAVNGFAVGAGFNLALAADMIIAAESAVFSQIFVQVALVPDYGGLYFLTRAVGLNRAKELCFTGRKLTATEGAEFGFVNRVVPDAELMDTAIALARQIARGPSTSLSLTKSLLNMASTCTLDEMADMEAFAQALAAADPDHQEGLKAFAEKRPPRYHPARVY